MKVKELIEELLKQPWDAEAVIAVGCGCCNTYESIEKIETGMDYEWYDKNKVLTKKVIRLS